MTITEWILVLTAAAFLLAPVAALSLRPIEDREALLRDVISNDPSRAREFATSMPRGLFHPLSILEARIVGNGGCRRSSGSAHRGTGD